MKYVLPTVVIAVVLIGTGIAPWLLVFGALSKSVFLLLFGWLAVVAVATVLAVVVLGVLALAEVVLYVVRSLR